MLATRLCCRCRGDQRLFGQPYSLSDGLGGQVALGIFLDQALDGPPGGEQIEDRGHLQARIVV
jgi:hypothetical protein